MYDDDEIMEEKKYGMFYLVRIVLKQKIFALITFLSLSLVIFIGLLFFAHNTSEYYTQFELDFIGIDEKKYPDGSYFNYSDIISEERVNQVKNSNAVFSSLDTNAILDGGNIKINEDFKYAADKVTRTKAFYEISIASKLFTSIEQAEAFFNELLDLELEKILSSSSILPRYLTSDFIGETTEYYNTAILIQRQYSQLLEYYQILLDEYSVKGLLSGENIYLNMRKITEYFSDANLLDSYVLEIVRNGYIKNASRYEVLLLSDIAVLEEERDLNAKKIVQLQTAGTSIQSGDQLSGVLAECLVRQEDVLHELELKNKLFEMCQTRGSNINTDFENRLNKLIETLNGFCDTYEHLYLKVINQRTAIQFLNNLAVLHDEKAPMIAIPFVALIMGGSFAALAIYVRFRWQEEQELIAEINNKTAKKK